MARKKKYLDEGYSSDSASSTSSTSQVDGSQRKRKRKSTKEDAIYGIFGSGSEGENEREGGAGRTVKAKDRKGHRVNYLKGQTFVPASGSVESNGESSKGSDTGGSSDGISDEDDDEGEEGEEMMEAERIARAPGTEMEEMETRNPFGLGPTREAAAVTQQHNDPDGFRPSSFVSSRSGIGAARSDVNEGNSRAGIGSRSNTEASHYPSFSRGGIGSGFKSESSNAPPTFTKSSIATNNNSTIPALSQGLQPDEVRMPTTFGATLPSDAFTQRKSNMQNANRPASFLTPSTTSIKFGGGMGGKFDPSKYLAQMGWTGGGLGRQGEGIVNPIEVKQRPERAGIAFGGIKEKTKQAKEEARRRGEEVSTDEEERDKRKKVDGRKARTKVKEDRGAPVWERTEKKPRKPKVEHRTYEQILEEHGSAMATSAGVGQIFDAAGNEYSSVSAALARHSVPTNEFTQLIEIRHNLRLICDENHRELQSLAKEGANIQEKHKWLLRDRDESRRRKLKEEQEVGRLRDVLDAVKQIERLGKASQTDLTMKLSSFDELIQRIIVRYRDVLGELHLDEAIVGAIVPLLRRQWAHWKPLEEPSLTINYIANWRDALRIDMRQDIMTPYESLLWNLWMPPVRSALNNDWDPFEPTPAVTLYESWKSVLSSFIVDNLTQQLIIPKLNQVVVDWDVKAPLHRALFPWIVLLGSQMDEVVAEAKRRLRSSLKSWKVSKGVPVDLLTWREAKVFSSNEWNSMLLDHVVPKLSSYMDSHFVIDLQAQDTRPLEVLLSWKEQLPAKVLSKILLAKFVIKWLQTLHTWLIDPRTNLEEVAMSYEQWKSWFGKQQLLQLSSLQEGFRVALQLMSQAMELGEDRRRLPLPNLNTKQASSSFTPGTSQIGNVEVRAPINTEDTSAYSFRKVVEEAMMEADLIMQSLNRKEIQSGMPLYRISKHLDGKGGVTLYLDEDVVFIEKREDGSTTYEPVSINDLVKQVA